jgi:hypothetical protein
VLTPELTYTALLIAQALHLLHHRLVKRHISFAEVLSAAVLCVPPTVAIPAVLLMGAHLALIAVQIVGSVWIRRLSPSWDAAR